MYLAIKTEISKNITISKESNVKRVSCPNSAYDSKRYCRIFQPDGTISPNGETCEISISTIFGNTATYECRIMLYGEMNELHSFINVFKAEEPVVQKAKIIETDTSYILTCQNGKGMCRAETPDKKTQLLIMDGLLMEHYSTYDTE